MPPIPADVLPRLQQWWTVQEAGNQAIFEAIYLDAPQVVSNVISGGAWVADGPEPGLAAQLGNADSFEANDQIPMLSSYDVPEIPMYGVAGSDMTIRWTETNYSKAALGAYVTDVYVQSTEGAQIAAVRLDGAGLEPGASAPREWTYTLPADTTAGPYVVQIYMNAEGSDPGSGVPGAQGFRNATGGQFEVGAIGESESQADQQDWSMWSGAMMALQRAGAASAASAIDDLKEGVNWLAASENITDEEREVVSNLGSFLEYTDPEQFAQLPDIDDKLATLGGIASRFKPEDNDSRARVVEALKDLRG